jgi:hypothetical protein
MLTIIARNTNRSLLVHIIAVQHFLLAILEDKDALGLAVLAETGPPEAAFLVLG